MPYNFTKLSVVLAALAVLFMSTPAFAQSQPSSGGDPFSSVPAVDSDEMSAVSGELAGGLNADISVPMGTDNRAAGTQRGGSAPSNIAGATTRDVSASGSSNFANQGSSAVTITNNNYGGIGGTGGLQQ